MTGSTFWAVVGIVLLVAAGVIVLREVRRTG
jgi:LPXTG-motif cell wall-anchored protein